MTKPDLAPDAALLAALKADMANAVDVELAARLRARVGESLSLGPAWTAAGAAAKPAATVATAGKVGLSAAGAGAAASGGGALGPLLVFTGAILVGGGVTFGLATRTTAPVPAQTPRTVASASSSRSAPDTRRAERERAAILEEPARQLDPVVAPPLNAAPPRASTNSEQKAAVSDGEPAHANANANANTNASGDSTLAEQQVLLDTARRALARGDGSTALEAVAWHRARFPRSKLAEEREALTIKALRAVGRNADSSVEAARFAARYPRSVFLPGLTDAGAIP